MITLFYLIVKAVKTMIIGLSGHIGSGKDTACAIIQKCHPNLFVELAFALNVKKVVAILTGTTLAENMDRKLRRKFIPAFNATLGQLQQKVGNGMRAAVGTNVWIEAILLNPSEFKIVTDVRFPDEVAAIEKAGGIVIRLERSRDHILKHDETGDIANDERPLDDISETALDNYEFKHRILNEGTLEELLEKLEAIIHPRIKACFEIDPRTLAFVAEIVRR